MIKNHYNKHHALQHEHVLLKRNQSLKTLEKLGVHIVASFVKLQSFCERLYAMREITPTPYRSAQKCRLITSIVTRAGILTNTSFA